MAAIVNYTYTHEVHWSLNIHILLSTKKINTDSTHEHSNKLVYVPALWFYKEDNVTMFEITSDNQTISGQYCIYISGQFNCCPDVVSEQL